MMEIVKPGLLGTVEEFKHRYITPITTGQYKDSNTADIDKMKRRTYALHNLVDPYIQRKGIEVLNAILPKRREYVIYVRLTEIQKAMFKVQIYGYKNVGNRKNN